MAGVVARRNDDGDGPIAADRRPCAAPEADGTAATDGEIADDGAAVDARDEWRVARSSATHPSRRRPARRTGPGSLGVSPARILGQPRPPSRRRSDGQPRSSGGVRPSSRGSAAPGGSSSAGRPPGSARSRHRCRRPSRAGARGRPRTDGSRRAAPSIPSRIARPAAGPSAMPAATARLSVTTGLPVIRSRRPYRARICDQSVSAARGARSWMAAIAAWIWYSPTRPRPIAPSRRAVPSAIRAAIPQPAILVGERDDVARRHRPWPAAAHRSAASARAARPPPDRPGAGRGPCPPSRIASSDRSTRWSSRPSLLA